MASLLAHSRFSFINPKYVKSTVEQGRGLTLTDDPTKLTTPVTEAFLHGMSKRQPWVKTVSDPESTIRRNWTDLRIEKFSMDVHGPFVSAINNARYFSSFTSEYNFLFVYFHKNVMADTLIASIKAACLELGTPRGIRMDRNQSLVQNDPTHLTAFQSFCLDRQIALKISPPSHCRYL